jgi:hypothetical protein
MDISIGGKLGDSGLRWMCRASVGIVHVRCTVVALFASIAALCSALRVVPVHYLLQLLGGL